LLKIIFMTKKTDKYFNFKMEIPSFVRFILKRLRQNNFKAFVVGGALRDAILGRNIIDWDISTNANVSEIKSVFSDIRQYALKHETVILVQSKSLFEITVMKRAGDSKLNINNDLSRRDFTINAMAYDDIKGIILDPHDGIMDIKNKIVRGVLDPNQRFREDPLRLLRAVRIAAELRFEIEDKTLDCMSLTAEKLKAVSVERIRDEFLRILLAEKPSKWINILRKTGVIKEVIPELLEGYRKKQNKWHRYTIYKHIMMTVDNVASMTVLRLAALLHDVAKPRVREKINGKFHFYNHEKISATVAQEIMERLRFSNETIKKVINLITYHMIAYNRDWTDGAVRRLIKRAGNDNVEDLIKLRRADILAHGIDHGELDLLDELEQRIGQIGRKISILNVSDLAIDGKKIMKILDFKQGPSVGNAMKMLHEIVIDNPELNTEEKLTEILIEAMRNNSLN